MRVRKKEAHKPRRARNHRRARGHTDGIGCTPPHPYKPYRSPRIYKLCCSPNTRHNASAASNLEKLAHPHTRTLTHARTHAPAKTDTYSRIDGHVFPYRLTRIPVFVPQRKPHQSPTKFRQKDYATKPYSHDLER